MSQRDNFTGGFLLGTIVGGLVGGLVGAAIASRRLGLEDGGTPSLLSPGTMPPLDTEENIEMARQRLEDKIAQLNLAIDDARQQLGSVENRVSAQDPHREF